MVVPMKKQTLVIATVIALLVGFSFAANWYRGAEAERFDAALWLVESPDPEIDSALQALLGSEPFRASPQAAAAARFVLARRRGPLAKVPGPRRPNLLLVSIDTLRADRLGCYGYDRPTSPALDAE